MRRIHCVLVAFLFAMVAVCPDLNAKVKKVQGVGRWVQEEHMTGEQATELAFREAKKDALRAAGIEERVWSAFSMVSSSDVSNPFLYEAWAENSILTIDGMLQVIDKKVTPEWNAEEGLPVKVVTITAYVDDEQRNDDPAYRLQIEDLADVYKDGDKVKFKLRIHGSDSFLKVFCFSPDSSALFYPHVDDMASVFKKNTDYWIPETGHIYARKSEGAVTGNFTFMLVATKRARAFATKPTPENIMKWFFSIPADERTAELREITIL